MTDVLKHKKVSGAGPPTDPADVGGDDWDDEHVFAGGSDGQVLVRDTGETDGASWATPSSTSDWDTEVVKATDQTVTNNATLQNDTELFAALVSGGVYLIEFFIIYSGNDTTGDYKWQFTGPWWSFNGGVYTNPAATMALSTVTAGTTVNAWPSVAVTSGTDISHSKLVITGRLLIVANAASNIQFQFANAAAAAARESRTCAGSRLRIKRLV
jgi:hypothetical protein